MHKTYHRLLLFYYVAHFMSFTKAAEHLKTSKGYVSKEITNLERDIGSSLLHRNTRSLRLTMAGEELFSHAIQLVDAYTQAENTMSSLQNKASGVLRITSPSAYADYMLAPHLPRFLESHPDITLEMNLTGSVLNLVEEKIDVAIRLTHQPPPDRVAKRIGEYQMIICASKAYLDAHGTPKTPSDLTQHPCLLYSTEKHYAQWPFVVQGDAVAVSVNPTVSANAALILLNATLNDMGIARLPDYVVRDALHTGQLTQILTPFYPQPIPVYAIYAQSRLVSPKIRAFIKFLQTLHPP